MPQSCRRYVRTKKYAVFPVVPGKGIWKLRQPYCYGESISWDSWDTGALKNALTGVNKAELRSRRGLDEVIEERGWRGVISDTRIVESSSCC